MKFARYFVLSAVAFATLHADEPKPAGKIVFHSDFASAKVGATPEGFLILGGEYKVKEIDGKKILELPGAPLDDFGALFGPAQADHLAVRARIRSEGTRRLAPRFGVGLGGASGYRLLLMPTSKQLQLFKDQQVVASAPFEWQSGVWTWFELRLKKSGEGKWSVDGKAWLEGKEEPKDFAIHFDTTSAPTAGKASVWGAPYSDKPIEFDELSVISLAE